MLLKESSVSGLQVPSLAELEAQVLGKKMTVPVYLVDGTCVQAGSYFKAIFSLLKAPSSSYVVKHQQEAHEMSLLSCQHHKTPE